MLRIIKFLFVLSIVVIGLAVHLRNDQAVFFDYYLGGLELPFSLFLIMALCLGALLGIAASLPVLVGHQRRHNPIMRKAKAIVSSGMLGRPVSATRPVMPSPILYRPRSCWLRLRP